jgi:hypothetical protein
VKLRERERERVRANLKEVARNTNDRESVTERKERDNEKVGERLQERGI